MGEQGKFYNLLKGINYGSPLWFSTPLYIGGGTNLHHRYG